MSTDTTLVYTGLIAPLANEALPPGSGEALDAPDRRDGRLYDYDPHLQMAVEVALATGRPLLLRGEPGSGKSSLAAFIARNLGYRYYETVITSHSSAQDLLWKYDLVRRLADAQTRGAQGDKAPLSDYDYIEPGVLWWVFDRESAALRGWHADSTCPEPAPAGEPNAELNASRAVDRAVVLIDELDKADPDLPNALLVPLGSMAFEVSDIRERPVKVTLAGGAEPALGAAGQAMSRLLVVITTNEERELPPAFMRRCIVHRLEHPGVERLVGIARLHFNRPPKRSFGETEEKLARQIAKRLEALRDERAASRRRLPGTAEYLDAVRAALTLGIGVGGGPAWEALQRATLLKDDWQAT